MKTTNRGRTQQQPGCDGQERWLKRWAPGCPSAAPSPPQGVVLLVMRWKTQSRAEMRLQLRVPSTRVEQLLRACRSSRRGANPPLLASVGTCTMWQPLTQTHTHMHIHVKMNHRKHRMKECVSVPADTYTEQGTPRQLVSIFKHIPWWPEAHFCDRICSLSVTAHLEYIWCSLCLFYLWFPNSTKQSCHKYYEHHWISRWITLCQKK